MIYPIVAFGDPVLKKQAADIDENFDIKTLVADMFETMENANGVGLAAPQIGKAIRVFIVDATPVLEDGEEFRKAFINPTILEESGEPWPYEEGCLSIPGIREDVSREPVVKIHYFDENWNEYEEEYDGMIARVIQHEYDHIEGVLFTDYLSAFKKRLIKNKLTKISKGIVDVGYKMKFPQR